MNELTEDDKKRLTGFLGKCWHEPLWHGQKGIICALCGKSLNGMSNNYRTFSTPDDRQALCERLVVKGKWEKFIIFCEKNYCREIGADSITNNLANFIYWVLVEQPERFCWLVSEWMKGKEAT